MPGNTLFKHFFGAGRDVDPEDRFDLNRKSRSKRLREIYSILVKHHFLRGFTPEELRQTLEDLGPSFVKIGQTLSTRSEILPVAYCEELAKLQSSCDPLPFDQVIEALKTIYGQDLDSVFSSIDPKPLGSASLAQVHKAQLATGEIVAVKVQRPGVKTTMAQDIDIMRIMAQRASRLAKSTQMVDFSDVVEEMWETFLKETDFACEAENLQKFQELNKDVAFIGCPIVYPDLCSEYCLVMEYVDGTPIHDHDKLVELGYDLSEIGEKMIDNYATQILEHGFFHADPHPGNILVRDGKVVYIDLGIMGTLSPVERAAFGTMIQAVGAQDPGGLKDALLSFAIRKDSAAIDHSRLLADLDMMLASYTSQDVADLDIGQLLADIVSVTRLSKVVLPTSVTNVSRGIVTIEGTIAEFIPNESIASIINDHIIRSGNPVEKAKDELIEAAIEMRRASEGLTQAASYAGETLRMLTRGQLKINMNMLASERLVASLGRIMNRLAMSIVIAGLFIGSSLYTPTGDDVLIFGIPFISFFGWLGAFILSVGMFFSIWRKK